METEQSLFAIKFTAYGTQTIDIGNALVKEQM